MFFVFVVATMLGRYSEIELPTNAELRSIMNLVVHTDFDGKLDPYKYNADQRKILEKCGFKFGKRGSDNKPKPQRNCTFGHQANWKVKRREANRTVTVRSASRLFTVVVVRVPHELFFPTARVLRYETPSRPIGIWICFVSQEIHAVEQKRGYPFGPIDFVHFFNMSKQLPSYVHVDITYARDIGRSEHHFGFRATLPDVLVSHNISLDRKCRGWAMDEGTL